MVMILGSTVLTRVSTAEAVAKLSSREVFTERHVRSRLRGIHLSIADFLPFPRYQSVILVICCFTFCLLVVALPLPSYDCISVAGTIISDT